MLKKAQEDKDAVQAELDDMLLVFNDVEEKAEKYKTRLKELGQEVSDGEDDDGDDDGSDDE